MAGGWWSVFASLPSMAGRNRCGSALIWMLELTVMSPMRFSVTHDEPPRARSGAHRATRGATGGFCILPAHHPRDDALDHRAVVGLGGAQQSGKIREPMAARRDAHHQ